MAPPSNGGAEGGLEHSATPSSKGAESGSDSNSSGPSSTTSSTTASTSSTSSKLGVSDALGFMFRGPALPFFRGGHSSSTEKPPAHSASAPTLGAALPHPRPPTPPASPTLSVARDSAGSSAGSLPTGVTPSPTVSSGGASSFFQIPALASFGRTLSRPFQSRGASPGPRGAPELSMERRLEDAMYLQAVILNSSEIFAWLELGWSPGEADRGRGEAGGGRVGARTTPGAHIRAVETQAGESAPGPEAGSSSDSAKATAQAGAQSEAEAGAPAQVEAEGAGAAGENGTATVEGAGETEGKDGGEAETGVGKGTGAEAGEGEAGSGAAAEAEAEKKAGVPHKLQSFVDEMIVEFQSASTAEEVHLAAAFLRKRLWREGGRVRSLGAFLEQHSQQVLHSEDGGSFFRFALFKGWGGSSNPGEVHIGNDEHLLHLSRSWVRCLQASLQRAQAETEDLEEMEEEAVEEEGEEGKSEGKSSGREKGHEHSHTKGVGCTLCIDELGNMNIKKKVPKGYVSFPLLYATNRGMLKGARSIYHMFGCTRSDDMSYGIIWVSMPDSMGHLASRDQQEAAATWRYHLSRQGTPKDSVAVLAATPIDRDSWFGAGRNIATHAGDDRLLVYVHGYNTPFLNAVQRMALVAYTANFRGTCVIFTWPSADSSGNYAQAEDNCAWGVPDLVHLLHSLQSELHPSKTHLLAHSMGCRMLLYSLLRAVPLGPYYTGEGNREGHGRELGQGKGCKSADTPLYGSVVLAAPDIDRDEFFKSLPHLARGCESVTVYCSRDDQALNISKSLHGGHFRLGDFRGMPEAQVPPECRTWRERLHIVDTTGEDNTLLNHSYIFTSCCIVMDCTLALVAEVAPGQRPWLKQGSFPSGLQFWSFQDADKYSRHSRIPFMKQLGNSLGFKRTTSSESVSSNRSSSSQSSAAAASGLPHSQSEEGTAAEESGSPYEGAAQGHALVKKGSGNAVSKSAGTSASKASQKIWEEKFFKWQSTDAHEDGEMLVLSLPREPMEEHDLLE